jgi:hypothetical protein
LHTNSTHHFRKAKKNTGYENKMIGLNNTRHAKSFCYHLSAMEDKTC